MPVPVHCRCNVYSDLEPNRASISRRITESRKLKKQLTEISEKTDRQNKLYRCDCCGQHWQGSYAWNWDGREYLFKVPGVDIDQWREDPFVQPDFLLMYMAGMQHFEQQINPEETSAVCRVEGCDRRTIRLSACCMHHHLEQRQAVHILPQKPSGRYFPPYDGY